MPDLWWDCVCEGGRSRVRCVHHVHHDGGGPPLLEPAPLQPRHRALQTLTSRAANKPSQRLKFHTLREGPYSFLHTWRRSTPPVLLIEIGMGGRWVG